MEYMVLEIQDTVKIDGESTLKGYEKHVEVMSYSHNVSNPVQMSTSNTGRTTGRPNMGELVITKQVDATTPELNFYCCSAKDLGKVNLKIVRQDQDATNILYMQYKMEKTLVSSASVGGSGDIPIETITLNYSKLTWEYNQQKKELGKSGTKTKYWDNETNTGG